MTDTLKSMGSSPEEVAAFLAEQGVCGVRNSSRLCPVARYLNSLGFGLPTVDDTEISLWGPWGPVQFIPMPRPVYEFVERFDAGEFEHLAVHPRGRRTDAGQRKAECSRSGSREPREEADQAKAFPWGLVLAGAVVAAIAVVF